MCVYVYVYIYVYIYIYINKKRHVVEGVLQKLNRQKRRHACFRYMMIRNRQMRGRVKVIKIYDTGIVVGRQSLRLITCVRAWYTLSLYMTLLPSDELVVEVECLLPTWERITFADPLAPHFCSAADVVRCSRCKKASRTDNGKQIGQQVLDH